MRVKTAIALFLLLCVGAVLLGAFALANAAEVESVRDSQYEWTCENANGNLISGHTRQDKAFQSCYNAALADGQTYYVRGGSFRVTATDTIEPPPAGEQPYFQLTWNEGDGTVPLPWEFMPHFGQTAGRVEIDFTPAMLHTTGASQAIFDVPDHLGVWVWNDGIHGEWYNDAGERRLWRARWGLIEAGREVKIVVTWNAAGYAVLIDGVLRIHDWQTTPTTVYPDPQAVAGVYGSRADSTRPATGTFALRVYDKSASYDPCAVDVVGTINEGVPSDNSGAWSQGKAPECATASLELRWVNPTEYVNGDLIGPGELTEIRLYQDGQKIAGVNPDVAVYEATGLHAGREYCFEATAVAAEESDPSNQVCRTP